ncbi:MAG: GNAT family N-acetyltransferase [Bdellovibrionota bacterium]
MISIAEQMGRISFRRYRAEDLPQVLSLFTTVFGVPCTQKDWEWKFRNYLQPNIPLIVLAEEQNRIVGMFCAVRHLLNIKRVPRLCFQSVDTAVLPEHRNQGLRKALYREFTKYLAAEGDTLLFGFPSLPHLRTGLKHQDYADLGLLEYFECRQPPARIPDASPVIRINNFGMFAADVERLSSQLARRFPVCVVRSPEYLDHRYLLHPRKQFACFGAMANGRLAAISVAAVDELDGKHVGTIYEAYGDEALALGTGLLAHVTADLFSRGCQSVRCWYRGSDVYRKALGESGFLPVAREDIRPAVGLPLFCSDAQTVLDGTSWHLTLGDSDL